MKKKIEPTLAFDDGAGVTLVVDAETPSLSDVGASE